MFFQGLLLKILRNLSQFYEIQTGHLSKEMMDVLIMHVQEPSENGN